MQISGVIYWTWTIGFLVLIEAFYIFSIGFHRSPLRDCEVTTHSTEYSSAVNVYTFQWLVEAGR